jgi:hypothetical protein
MIRKLLSIQPVEYSEAMGKQRTVKDVEAYFKDKRDDITNTYRVAISKHDTKALAQTMRRINEYNKEIMTKKAAGLVTPMSISVLMKNAGRVTPTKKNWSEISYQANEL